MNVHRIAAFSSGTDGGNPAGVVIADTLPDRARMQAIAHEVGYSETAFAAPAADGAAWTVRYFAPEQEVPFCGHATIALGTVLGRLHGPGTYDLNLSRDAITVSAHPEGDLWAAELRSPPTRSAPLDADLRDSLLDLFHLAPSDLDPRLPPTLASGGATHALLALKDRAKLAAMSYDFETGRRLMLDHGLVTISLLHITSNIAFAARNAFAFGGVVEDPATGAAAAALGGALVDQDWPGLSGGGTVTIRQGDDMGIPAVLTVTVTGHAGDPVRVGGTARIIT
ncbi:MAG: PhzF family phenazine biosynthesis isomerase [Pseudomonadota bacterium]